MTSRKRAVLAIAAGIGIALVAAYLLSRTTFRAEITIRATPGEVWDVLTDTAGYRDWNPLLVPLEGRFEPGATVRYRMTDPQGKQTQLETVIVEAVPGVELRQTGGMPGLLTMDHAYRLQPVPEGTRLIQQEADIGLWMYFWDESWVQPMYERVNRALKDRVENLTGGSNRAD